MPRILIVIVVLIGAVAFASRQGIYILTPQILSNLITEDDTLSLKPIPHGYGVYFLYPVEKFPDLLDALYDILTKRKGAKRYPVPYGVLSGTMRFFKVKLTDSSTGITTTSTMYTYDVDYADEKGELNHITFSFEPETKLLFEGRIKIVRLPETEDPLDIEIRKLVKDQDYVSAQSKLMSDNHYKGFYLQTIMSRLHKREREYPHHVHDDWKLSMNNPISV